MIQPVAKIRACYVAITSSASASLLNTNKAYTYTHENFRSTATSSLDLGVLSILANNLNPHANPNVTFTATIKAIHTPLLMRLFR